MQPYLHHAKYYETDQMGIIHHSNYIRWMEEARVFFFEQIGYPYDKLEEDGIISPVVSVECEYKLPTKFCETINVEVGIKEFKGVKLIVEYKMFNEKNEIVAVASSKHCFVNEDNRPIVLKKSFPELAKIFTELTNIDKWEESDVSLKWKL